MCGCNFRNIHNFPSCPQQKLHLKTVGLHLMQHVHHFLTELIDCASCLRSVEMASDLALTASVSRIRTVSCGQVLHNILAKLNNHSYDIILLRAILKTPVYEQGSNHVILLVSGWFFHIWYINNADYTVSFLLRSVNYG